MSVVEEILHCNDSITMERFPTTSAVPEKEDEKAEGAPISEKEKGVPSPDYGPMTPEEEQVARREERERGALKEIEGHFRELRSSRDPAEEIDIGTEQTRIAEQLEEVKRTQETAPEEEQPKLNEIRKELEQDEVRLKLADEYNEVLSELYDLRENTPEEFEAVRKTGRKRNGERLRGRDRFLSESEAKELASFSKEGGLRRMTWGAFQMLYAMADRVITDALSAVRNILR